MKDTKHFMTKAVEAAIETIHKKEGGPFGAIVVKNNEIVGYGKNQVEKNTDPTAHAEVTAIRNACKNLNTLELKDCVLYVSAEPCPMCLGAIYWSKIEKVYFGSSKEDSANAGFEDKFIYEEININPKQRNIPFIQTERDLGLKPFKVWQELDKD